MMFTGAYPGIEEQVTVRGLPITPGASDLLYVTLEALGKVVVHDASDVTLVETHTERYCGNDDA